MKILQKKLSHGGRLDIYALEHPSETMNTAPHPCVIVCPGGAYAFVSNREGEPAAKKFLAEDITACVLWYSAAPDSRFPVQLRQLFEAISYLRDNADELKIDKNRIVVCGFSAGGHLAASACTLWNKPEVLKLLPGFEPKNIRPDGGILCYPVISSVNHPHVPSFEYLLGEDYNKKKELVSLENAVDKNTPPAFIWHTADDSVVPAMNSILYAQKLAEFNTPFELHIYPSGPHGLSCCDETSANKEVYPHCISPDCAAWVPAAIKFVKNIIK